MKTQRNCEKEHGGSGDTVMRGNRLCQVQICKKLGFSGSTGYDEEFHPVFLAPIIFIQYV